jgi:hypothetical protein
MTLRRLRRLAANFVEAFRSPLNRTNASEVTLARRLRTMVPAGSPTLNALRLVDLTRCEIEVPVALRSGPLSRLHKILKCSCLTFPFVVGLAHRHLAKARYPARKLAVVRGEIT